MAILILLRGNSGSGKTTVANALQWKFGPNTLLLSHDRIRMDMLHVWGREGVEKSLPLMTSLLQYGREHCAVTIMEGILHAADYAPLFDAAVALFGTDLFAYYYDLPFEETLRRHATKPNRCDFGEPEMRRWWREKDFLPQISETVLTQTVGIDEAVSRILHDVQSKHPNLLP